MSRSALVTCLVLLMAGWFNQSSAADDSSGATVGERFQLEESAAPVRERSNWKKPERILIVGSPPEFIERLEADNPGIDFVTASNAIEAQSKASNVDAVIGVCTPGVIAAGKQIRWVQVYSAGVEGCTAIPSVRDRDLLITNMQRIMGPVIAEHVLAMTLAFARGLDAFIPLQKQGAWRRGAAVDRMAVIEGKTMLVVGLGGIGSEVGRRAHALGMRVIAIRASGRTGPDFVSYVGLPDELLKLAREADVVVNAVPLTPETTGIFNAAFFNQMKPTAHFINIGRGKSVVTADLVAALANGKIAGAGLDVTEPEPLPPEHPLWQLPNVIITPHVASASDLGNAARMEVVAENIRRYAAGERMFSVVDVSRGY